MRHDGQAVLPDGPVPCDLAVVGESQGRSLRVEPDGPIPCDLAVIGESPGNVELEQGRGFVGPSGQMLWGSDNLMVYCSGRERESVYVSNVCKIPLPEPEWIRLHKDEQKRHIDELVSELVAVKPKLVLAFGTRASRVLYPEFSTMTDCHGNLGYNHRGFLVMPLWHPSYILRGNASAKTDLIVALSEVPEVLSKADEIIETIVTTVPKELFGDQTWPESILFLNRVSTLKSKCTFCGAKTECSRYEGLGLRWNLCKEHAIRTSIWASTKEGDSAMHEHADIEAGRAIYKSLKTRKREINESAQNPFSG